MVSKISLNISKLLEKKEVIIAKDIELYAYAVEVLIITLLPFSLIILKWRKYIRRGKTKNCYFKSSD